MNTALAQNWLPSSKIHSLNPHFPHGDSVALPRSSSQIKVQTSNYSSRETYLHTGNYPQPWGLGGGMSKVTKVGWFSVPELTKCVNMVCMLGG